MDLSDVHLVLVLAVAFVELLDENLDGFDIAERLAQGFDLECL